VPIQLAQCWFPGLSVFNDKIQVYFSKQIHGSKFVKQHSETVTVCIYENADCSFLERNFVVLFIIIFGPLSFPVVLCLLLAASLGENNVLVGSFAAVSRACDAAITWIRVLFGFLV